MDGALDAIFARAIDHLLGGFAVFDGAAANLAQQFDACIGEVFEVLLDHAVLDHRRACHDFDAERRKFSCQRWAAIAIALRPMMSRGRPGMWTSPAEIKVVTPPCRVESIQCNCCWRGV